jgi:pimeloyl-ACP methyl ester carboxylesterase
MLCSYEMASRPHHDASSERPEERLQAAPYTSRFVEAGGLRLHYLDYGAAGRRPMLCVHGGGAHAHWFDFVAPGLSADYHVRALDLRGHGDSAVPDSDHHVTLDNPSGFVRAVRAFLARHS